MKTQNQTSHQNDYQQTTLNSRTLTWHDYGTSGNPPMLLLHGTSLNFRSFHDVGQSLAEHYHAIAPNIRGHGDTWASENNSYDLPQMSSDILELANFFWSGRKVILVGASISGLHAIEFTSTHPTLVEALILVDVLPSLKMDSISSLLEFTKRSFKSVDDATNTVLKLFESVPAQMRPSESRIKELFGRFLSQNAENGTFTYNYDHKIVDSLKQIQSDELWSKLTLIQQPVLLLEAETGSLVSEEGRSKFLSITRNPSHQVVPGSRHNIMHDNPTGFISAINSFLSKKLLSGKTSAIERNYEVTLRGAWCSIIEKFENLDIEKAEYVIDCIINAYGGTDRHHHNLKHIVEMLAWIEISESSITDISVLQLATLFHDYVYDSKASDNEERSAQWTSEMLRQIGFPDQLVDAVCALVRATKDHRPILNMPDSKIFLNADLAILGMEPHRYDEYATAIRREYDWVDQESYHKGRIKVLESFLSRQNIFFDQEEGSASLEVQARRNIIREINQLNNRT